MHIFCNVSLNIYFFLFIKYKKKNTITGQINVSKKENLKETACIMCA